MTHENRRPSQSDSGVLFLLDSLGSLSRLIAAIVRGSTHEVLGESADALVWHREFDACAIHLQPVSDHPGGTDAAALAATSGAISSISDLATERSIQVMRTGRAQRESDLSVPAGQRHGSLLIVPIATSTRCLGTLTVWNKAPFRFQQWHESLIELHCDVLSLFLSRHEAPGGRPAAPSGGVDPTSPDRTAAPQDERARSPSTHAASAPREGLDLDPLTGLLDRSAFEASLRSELGGEARPSIFLLYLDVDRYRLIRESGGRQTAERVIRILADVLRQHLGQEVALGRLDSDEFGIALERDTLAEAVAIAQGLIRIVDSLRMSYAGQSYDISVSIGLASPVAAAHSSGTALQQAQDACRAAQRQGGGIVQVYDESVATRRRTGTDGRMLNELTSALKEDRLELYAQPIVPAAMGPDESGTLGSAAKPAFYEVLLRMRDRCGNPRPAAAFLPLAERYGLSVKLDRWVVRETFRLLSSSPRTKRGQIRFTVNLSGHSIDEHRLLDDIVAEFETTGLPPETICFEITETAAISDIDAAKTFIQVLKGIGCRFALDDFGSGHSSFLYLRDLQVDFLKIDGTLVCDIAQDPVSHAFVRSINDIGKIMGKRTIAEYVETAEVLEAVTEIGIDFAQGYWIGRPEPLVSIARPKGGRGA